MLRPGWSRFACLALLALGLAACGGSSPPPSTTDPPGGGGERISGNERLGWNQSAASTGELGTFRYAAYVDTGNRAELTDVSCGNLSSGASPCNSRMPTMSPGAHTIELVSFVLDGTTTVESGRSAVLRVTVTGAMTGGPAPTPAAPPATLVQTSDGIELRLDVITEQLELPTAIAPAPDGRVFVAEREGRVRVIANGALDPQPAVVIDEALMTPSSEGGLLALALDKDFERTRFVYVAYTMSAAQGTRQFRVARYREVNGRLGERVVLLDGIPAAPRPAVSLGVGPDGRLYAALDAAANGSGRAAALASYSGKVLRLNTDGTAPQDQPPGQLAVAADLQSPRGLDWHPSTNTLVVADARRADLEELRIVGTPAANTRSRMNLPSGFGAAGMAFYRGTLLPALSGDLFVAAAEGHHLLRIRLDERNPPSVVATERLLQDLGVPIRAVAASGDGTIYAATDRSLLRLGPR